MSWLQGGPFLEVGFILHNKQSREEFIKEFLRNIKSINYNIHIVEDLEDYINEFIQPVQYDKEIIYPSCKINITIEISGIRKSVIHIEEIASETVSVDVFHQETIPIDYVKNFAKAIVKEGVFIQTHPAWLISAEDDNPYNQQTREILEQFSLLGISTSSGNVIFPSGNAKKYLNEYFDKNTDYDNPYEENPKDVRAICFSPNGDVLNGNVNRECIMDILNSYSVND